MLGRPFAKRWGNEADLDRLDRLSQRYGPLVLVVTRALPLLSEASVLLLGLSGLRWLPAALAILLSNAAIAAVYVSFGAWFQGSPALPWAVVASALLPLLPLWWVRKRLQGDADSAPV
jgi:3-dehydroquinate synthase